MGLKDVSKYRRETGGGSKGEVVSEDSSRTLRKCEGESVGMKYWKGQEGGGHLDVVKGDADVVKLGPMGEKKVGERDEKGYLKGNRHGCQRLSKEQGRPRKNKKLLSKIGAERKGTEGGGEELLTLRVGGGGSKGKKGMKMTCRLLKYPPNQFSVKGGKMTGARKRG